MRKIEINELRELLKTYMLENNYGFFQVSASMSVSKDNVVLSVTYDESSDTHLNGYDDE